ncbi:MAG: hypothetical protein NC548_61575 [Lachnospiraceae bacterium]|nr:hypothetical protein [Lachnospiraceae bacterium]
MVSEIPREIPNKQEYSQLKAVDRKIIAFAVLMGVSNQEAFMRYNPHYLRADGKGMNEAGVTASRQFWGWGKVKDYRAEYEKTIEDFFGGGERKASEVGEVDTKRKDKALRSLLNQAMSLVEGGTDLDADTIKVCSDIFTKLGLIKSDEQRVEPARRYLPTRCHSECAYRLFVESHIESGDIISECDYCRTRKFAEEQGWKFDPTKNLDIPIEDSNG